MATFDQLAQIAAMTAFQQRVAYALAVAALAVYNETPTTTGHAVRAAYAVKVLSGVAYPGSSTMLAIANGVLSNPTIASEANPAATDQAIPDSDIQFQVNSMWNALAGA